MDALKIRIIYSACNETGTISHSTSCRNGMQINQSEIWSNGTRSESDTKWEYPVGRIRT